MRHQVKIVLQGEKISAPGSRNLGLEQSGGGGSFLASHRGKVWFTTLEVVIKGGTEGVGVDWVPDLWFNLFDDRKGAHLGYLNRNYPETFAL